MDEVTRGKQGKTRPSDSPCPNHQPVFVFASDSFKGTLSSPQVAEILTDQAREVFPQAVCRRVAVADGGEGTAQAVCSQADGAWQEALVHGPLGRPHTAGFCLLPDGTAVLDMAAASGLTLVEPEARNPLQTSTFGTGELIRAALDAGACEIYLGIGGSATVDGGVGMLRALGVRFFDSEGEELPGRGADLARVDDVRLDGLDPRLASCRITVMSDVDNPLLGDDGAAHVFGPQKGADPAMVEQLEHGMARYAARLSEATGTDYASAPGAGAAGGLGFSLMGVLGAHIASGIDCVLDLIGFDRLLEDATLCVTGEGRLDEQTLHGKVPLGVASRCARAHVPCAAVVGFIAPGIDLEPFTERGLSPIVPCVDADAASTQSITPQQAVVNLRRAAKSLFETLASKQ
jgi:glycerate kinase